MQTRRLGKIIVRKKSGRLEPFDSRKMARSVSRAGIPYLSALRISKKLKNSETLMQKGQISSATLRRMVAREIVDGELHDPVVARSYLGYKRTRRTDQRYLRSHKPRSLARKQTRSRAKQDSQDKHKRRGRPPRW